MLVCGARRLAAIKKLGWRTVGVWVRSGISDQLGLLLAEQGDNAHHKELTPVEAAALHRELKMLMAEDAARGMPGLSSAVSISRAGTGPENFRPRWTSPSAMCGSTLRT